MHKFFAIAIAISFMYGLVGTARVFELVPAGFLDGRTKVASSCQRFASLSAWPQTPSF